MPAGLGFAITGAVAVGYAALAFADGGFEPAVWAQATILVWWTVLVALLARAWPRSPVPIAAVVTGASLLALTALTGASLAWTADLGAAYTDALRGAGYLGVFALAAIASRAGAGRAFLVGVAGGLFVICAASLLSRLEPGLVDSADEARGLRVSGGRLSWPLGYWNAIGACAAAAVPLLVWLAASAGTVWRRALAAAVMPSVFLTMFFSGSRGGVAAQTVAIVVLLLAGPRRVTLLSIVAIAFIPAMILAGIASSTPELVNGEETAAAAGAGDRILVLTILASLAVAAVIYLADRRIARLRLPVIGVRRAAVVAVVIGALWVIGSNPIEWLRTFDDPPATTQATSAGTRLEAGGSSGRAQFWNAALEAFESEPLRGIGAGSYEQFWALHGTLDFTVVHAHSLFFESAAELGVLGALLAVALFAVPAAAGVRRLMAPTSWARSETATGGVGAALAVLGAGATMSAADWAWDMPAAFIPTVAAAAYLCVPPWRREMATSPVRPLRRRRRRPRRPSLPLVAALAIGAAAAASIAGSIAIVLSDAALDRSERAVASGDLGEAAVEAREASDWLPFAAPPMRQLAMVENARGQTAAARRAIDEAQALATGDWQLWLTEAGIELGAGRIGRGIYALSRAEALNPKAPARLFAVPTGELSVPSG